MVRVAAQNHRTLCIGQGEELCGTSQQRMFSSAEIIEIARRKTSPAFGVSLLLGSLAAGANDELLATLQAFSESLGIAYQIRDDLEEYQAGEVADLSASIILALAREVNLDLPDEPRGVEKASQLLEHYKNEAIRALNPLESAALKTLLRRLASKILGGQE